MFNEFVEFRIKQCLVDTPSKHDFYLFGIKIIQSSIKNKITYVLIEVLVLNTEQFC